MKNWFAISALACALSASAQPPAPSADIVGIAHVALRVSDLDGEIAFLGKLGYEESFAITSAGQTMAVLVKINDEEFIELTPRTDPSQPLGWIHVCYRAGDLQALVQHFASSGLEPSRILKTDSGNLLSSLRDPDGSSIEFTEYMPGSRHVLDRGQHMGENRIATELLGVDLPVSNLAAEKQFYTQLGFESEGSDTDVHLTAPGAPGLRIELRPAKPGAEPQLLFPVDDARKAADRIKDLKPVRDKGILFVRDPDGNSFVFLQTGGEHRKSLMPWTH
jgi:catechol 2,3-dioxygenase-like lactoylglutathione lyase family enzyme